MGTLVDRVHRDLSDEDIAKIAYTYHAWKRDPKGLAHDEDSPAVKSDNIGSAPASDKRPLGSEYKDIPGFCKSVTIEEIRAQGYVLTPGRYVGAAELEEDDEPFEQKMARLAKELEMQFEENDQLEKTIRKNLKSLTYGN